MVCMAAFLHCCKYFDLNVLQGDTKKTISENISYFCIVMPPGWIHSDNPSNEMRRGDGNTTALLAIVAVLGKGSEFCCCYGLIHLIYNTVTATL